MYPILEKAKQRLHKRRAEDRAARGRSPPPRHHGKSELKRYMEYRVGKCMVCGKISKQCTCVVERRLYQTMIAR